MPRSYRHIQEYEKEIIELKHNGYTGRENGGDLHRYPNLLNRDFKAERPNQKWVTDISYIKISQGTLYLSIIRDLYDNSIVAYKTGAEQNINLVLQTIREAKKKEKVTAELQLHSDQGFQYTSQAYYRLTKSYNIKLKTYDEARLIIDEYIDFYNNERIQLKTKLTPQEMRCQYIA